MKRLFSLPAFVFALFLRPLLGCGKKGDDVKLVPVKGAVTVGGVPLTYGVVQYWPTAGKEAATGASSGQIGSDGTYTLKTFGKDNVARDGAPEGSYTVTVSPGTMAPPQGAPEIPQRYRMLQSFGPPLIPMTVPSQNYDIKLDKE
jgi:hypothetical protein